MTHHRFVDRDMFVRFAGIGVGHEAQFGTRVNSDIRDDLELDEEPLDTRRRRTGLPVAGGQ